MNPSARSCVRFKEAKASDEVEVWGVFDQPFWGGHGWVIGCIPKRGLNLVAWYIDDKLPSYR